MIKQSATYGVWEVRRHEDNKIDVYKNGQLCDNSSAALREIAAEVGLEVNPDWRTSQLGRNVMKAILLVIMIFQILVLGMIYIIF